nr:capsular biosynthesis protein [Brevibacillus fulvus]
MDGTICRLKQGGESYGEVLPIPGAAEALRQLKQEGHEIIIYTARSMRTEGGNAGKVIANVGKTTLEWLAQHQIEYDEIVFGKPYGQVYIDDLAISFTNWQEVLRKLRREEGSG